MNLISLLTHNTPLECEDLYSPIHPVPAAPALHARFIRSQPIQSIKASDIDDVFAAVGGENALFNEFPYMAALGWNDGENINDFLCGGVLIDFNYVLTAAHCISMRG